MFAVLLGVKLVRRLCEWLMGLVRRRQYWLLAVQVGGTTCNMFSDKSPGVTSAEHFGSRMVVLNAIRLSKRDYDDGRKVLQEQRSADRKRD